MLICAPFLLLAGKPSVAQSEAIVRPRTNIIRMTEYFSQAFLAAPSVRARLSRLELVVVSWPLSFAVSIA